MNRGKQMEDSRAWLTEALTRLRSKSSERHCVSFSLGGRGSGELLPAWALAESSKPGEKGRTHHQVIRTDPETGLELRVDFTEYPDYPVVEWVAHLRNTSGRDTPLIEGLKSLDAVFKMEPGGFLHHMLGDSNTEGSYRPFRVKVWAETELRFAPVGGRATNGAWPYFNLEMKGGKSGVIIVIGWPAQWAAHMRWEEGLRIRAGQETTRFVLHPGEEVRTPLSVLMFWRGDRAGSQNMWRRWLLDHNLPSYARKPIQSLCVIPWDEVKQKASIDCFTRHGVKPDLWWMDAGWYKCGDGPAECAVNTDWFRVGTWEYNPRFLPNGLKPVGDYARRHGMKFIVWFEPERVWEGSWLDQNHPEWLTKLEEGQRPTFTDLAGWYVHGRLFDLGNPEAWKWMLERIDKILTEEGIDWYRQDHNIDPLWFWRVKDAPDRQGMSEMRHVEGYLALWDELLRRHPGMLIDSCASGGRRNDIETVRRSVPLLRSDYQSFKGDSAWADGNQGHTWGLSRWLPYQGQGVCLSDDHTIYCARSYFCSAMGFGVPDPREKADWKLYRRIVAEWRRAAPCYLGDFYPLTPHSVEPGAWMAWQFDRPDLGEGVVQAFRHRESPYESATFQLGGLAPRAEYLLEDSDTGKRWKAKGGVLMKGFHIEMPEPFSSRLIFYSHPSSRSKRK